MRRVSQLRFLLKFIQVLLEIGQTLKNGIEKMLKHYIPEVFIAIFCELLDFLGAIRGGRGIGGGGCRKSGKYLIFIDFLVFLMEFSRIRKILFIKMKVMRVIAAQLAWVVRQTLNFSAW